MKIVIAPDSFKGSLSASQAALAIERGIKKALGKKRIDKVRLVKLPVADGGEGTLDAFLASSGKKVSTKVTGPLGNKVAAKYVLIKNNTAVIEMAQASGLLLVPPAKRNPLLTTSYGTGELISRALDKGVKKIILGIGGSATNDGGLGVAEALGIRFMNKAGQPLGFGCQALRDLATIDSSGRDKRLLKVELVIAADVKNKLCGDQGASGVYGPQKGATPAMVKKMDAYLRHYSEVIYSHTHKDISNKPSTGAAGGVVVPLITWFNGKIQSGIEVILEALDFESHLRGADLIITGEGSLDRQTLQGKVIKGLAGKAKKHRLPLIVLTGRIQGRFSQFNKSGMTSCFSIVPGPLSLEQAIQGAASYLEDTAERVMRLYNV